MDNKFRNQILFLTLALLFCGFAFVTFFTAEARISNLRIAAATPTPTPSPISSPSPPVSPTATKPSPTPPDDDEVIRIETELVNLSVRVVDQLNRPVNVLSSADFRVYENNVLQPIDSFTKAEVPTNYALVIDNSGSLRSQLEKVIEASKILVGTNKPDDETAVIRFVSSDKIEITQEFTNNRAEIEDALENLYVEGGQTAIIDAVYLASEKVDEYEKSRNPSDKKRRALILVSDGEDRDSYYNEQQLFSLLREADVQIYVVGFTGELDKEGGLIKKSPKAKAEGFLRKLADETGGKAYFPNSVNELNGIARDIASELRTQYLISYYPTDPKKDGSYRSIKVTVVDGPNKQKRIAITRSGRTVPTEKKDAPMLQKPAQSRPDN